jgi:hypothetical protein
MIFALLPLLINLAIGITLTALAYLIMPKPKAAKPEIQDMDNPTADAGRPIPYVVGTKTVKGVNLLWYGEKSTSTYSVKA